MKFIIVAAVIFVLPLCGFATSPLTKGSVSVGGSAALPLKWDTFGNLVVRTDVSPSASYFFSDNWELMGALRIQGTVYQSEFVRDLREPVRYGAQIGVNYYFDLANGFFPFIGIGAGFEIAE